jgi:hypothetical protein
MHSTQSPAVTPGRQQQALGPRLLMAAAIGGAMNANRLAAAAWPGLVLSGRLSWQH